MLEKRSLRTPITLGVVMIVVVVALAGIWVAGTTWAATESESQSESFGFYTLLAVGGVLLATLLGGVIAYLTLTVKAFNLNRRQSNFIDAVTHELKSPIASLKLYLQTMNRHQVDHAQRDDFHRFMLEDVERLDSLINHLLDVARVDRVVSDAEISDRKEFRLDRLLATCASAATLRYGVDESVVQLDLVPLVVKQSPVQTEILFRNLIDNAVKYAGAQPSVDVRLRAEDSKAIIDIDDNGPGIPPQQRRKIFGRFVRLGSELERERPGTGLGLHLVGNITRAMKGSIRVGDRRPQPGSRFTVELPGVIPMASDADVLDDHAETGERRLGLAESSATVAADLAEATGSSERA